MGRGGGRGEERETTIDEMMMIFRMLHEKYARTVLSPTSFFFLGGGGGGGGGVCACSCSPDFPTNSSAEETWDFHSSFYRNAEKVLRIEKLKLQF